MIAKTPDAASSAHVVLNLARLRLVSSMFLGMLLGLQKALLAADGTLRLCGLPPEVSAVFAVTKLNRVLAIVADEQSALESPDSA